MARNDGSQTRNLVALARDGHLDPVYGRDAEADAVLAALDRGASVLLVGPEGVGRRAVVRRVAQRMAERGRGDLVSGTADALRDRGDAARFVTDLVRRLRDPDLASGGPLVGVLTQGELRSAPGAVVDAFEIVAVAPLDAAEVAAALDRAARDLDLPLDPASRDAIVRLTSRFLPSRPQPGPALDLLAQVGDYLEQKRGVAEPEPVTPAFVEKVFSIYSGLPRFVVSRDETRSAEEVRGWFGERIVGQREAVEAVVEAVAVFKAGLHDPDRPLGTFLFAGPAGVGKAELGRALATFLFGSPHRLVRVDLAEIPADAPPEALLGRPGHPGTLAHALADQPFQVVLFEHLDAARPDVAALVTALASDGRARTASGETVDLRSAFVIAATEAGADTLGPEATRRERVLGAVDAALGPDRVRRFRHVVVFHPLDAEQLRSIARRTLRDLLDREGITGRNLVVDVDDDALDVIVRQGVDPRGGARALRRELQRQILVPLAMRLMEEEAPPGQVIEITGRDGHVRVRQLDPPERPALRPVRLDEPERAGPSTRADLAERLRGLHDDVAALSVAADEPWFRKEQQRLSELRHDHAFWQDAERAARILRDLDRATMVVERIDRLRSRVDALDDALRRADTPERLALLSDQVAGLEDARAAARRELVLMGPDGYCDAIVEVRPQDAAPMARDLLVRIQTAWADWKGFTVDWLHEPLDDDEPALFAVRGRYAFGLLQLEAGLHRVRDGEAHGVARVTVAPWTDRVGPVVFTEHRALKVVGAYGGKVRSRLACRGGLVLQNARTLAENRDLAVELAGSWAERRPPVDVVVRHYDLEAPSVRDFLTGLTSRRTDAVAPARYDALLARRIEAAGRGPEAA